MYKELRDAVMEALYEALLCGSEMLSSTSNDFRIQEIGERLIYAIDRYAHPQNSPYDEGYKDWARACSMTLSGLNPPCKE